MMHSILKFIKEIFQFFSRYGKHFISWIALPIHAFAKTFRKNFLYDLFKYVLILFLISLYVNRGYIDEVFLGEQSVYCQLCYHLEIEQEFVKVETRHYFDALVGIVYKGAKQDEKGYITLLSGIQRNSPEVSSLRSKIYDSLKKHNEISLAMRHSDCDRVAKRYKRNRSIPHTTIQNIESLCKFRKMSFFSKIIYRIKNMIYKISAIIEV